MIIGIWDQNFCKGICDDSEAESGRAVIEADKSYRRKKKSIKKNRQLISSFLP